MRCFMVLGIITNRPKVQEQAPLLYYNHYKRKSDGKMFCLLDFHPNYVALGHVGVSHQRIEYIPIVEFHRDYESANNFR